MVMRSPLSEPALIRRRLWEVVVGMGGWAAAAWLSPATTGLAPKR